MASILLIDDIPVVRLTVRKFLERGGHGVEECGSVQEAEERLRARSFDVVVTDLWMPGEDGLALIDRMKRRHRATPVIAITGGAPRSPQRVSIEEAARAGADRVLMKPVGMQEILSCVSDLVGRG
ncbi:response regulator [Methylobacterium sp. ID0610]|uniref:response regulator n=1 Tax=Methylobacterium carpenticola TaxID=3344827 RepID=UPI00368B6F61